MSTHDKILTGCQTLARHCKHNLEVFVLQDRAGNWLIQIRAGPVAAVQTTLDTFIRTPSIVLEPFTEELIRGMK